jgi:hypothetical protein
VRPWDGDRDDNLLVYQYGGEAQDPQGAKSGSFTYVLLPIWDLWEKKDQVGKGKVYLDTFDYRGASFNLNSVPMSFAGEKYGTGRANPPWAWTDGSLKSERGDSFFDPALYVFHKEQPAGDFSLDYIYHPYLGAGAAESLQLRGLAGDR